MEKQVLFWLVQADNDLPVAESMLEKGHYTWSLFIGHLVLEKTLKAIYVREHQKIAPRIHDLVKLAKSTSLHLNDEQLVAFEHRIANELPKGYVSFHLPLTMHGSYSNMSNRSRRSTVINTRINGH